MITVQRVAVGLPLVISRERFVVTSPVRADGAGHAFDLMPEHEAGDVPVVEDGRTFAFTVPFLRRVGVRSQHDSDRILEGFLASNGLWLALERGSDTEWLSLCALSDALHRYGTYQRVGMEPDALEERVQALTALGAVFAADALAEATDENATMALDFVRVAVPDALPAFASMIAGWPGERIGRMPRFMAALVKDAA